ncbi:MAG: hypothetical protein ABGX16_05455 [Pirellulales bacterium]
MIINPAMNSNFGHRWKIALLLSVLAFSLNAATSVLRWPTPAIHDEFSYLLAADTFSQGRLANQTHPFWQHFETFHVFHQPSYASKYPPGQGLILATGQWLVGQPIVGIWILSALTTATCYWMLLGWVSPRWAALGGLLFLVHPGYQIIWGQSYWGGTLAFLGGSLVFGAAAHMRRCPQVFDAIAMSLGALILAISRPYEGFVFCMIIGVVVIVHWWQHGLPAWRALALHAFLPQVMVFLIGGACLANYNYAVTGNWRIMPYQLHESIYGLSPCFLWDQPFEDREYNHAILSEFHHGWGMEIYRKQQSLTGLLETKIAMFESTWNHFFPLPLMLPLLFVPFCHARYKRTVIVVASIAWLSATVTVWNLPHYLAPMSPVLLILVLMGLRQANVWGKKYLNQPRLATLFVAFQIVFFSVCTINYGMAPKDTWQWRRAAIFEQLKSSPGRHLVFVHYRSDHNPHHEWVYNRANIDQSQVVWAREMGAARDRALLEYFQDRKAWVLDADASQPNLEPILRPMDLVLMKH